MVGPVSEPSLAVPAAAQIPTPEALFATTVKVKAKVEAEADLLQCHQTKKVVHGLFEKIAASGSHYGESDIRIDKPVKNECFQELLRDLKGKKWDVQYYDRPINNVWIWVSSGKIEFR